MHCALKLQVFLTLGLGWIIDGVVQTSRLLTLLGLAHDEITHIDDVSQLANASAHGALLEEFLGLLIEDVEAVPCTVKAKVAAHDAHISAHYLAHLLLALTDEHHLLGMLRALVVPLGDVGTVVIMIATSLCVFSSCLGIDYSLNQRVACEAVAAMQSCA